MMETVSHLFFLGSYLSWENWIILRFHPVQTLYVLGFTALASLAFACFFFFFPVNSLNIYLNGSCTSELKTFPLLIATVGLRMPTDFWQSSKLKIRKK